jgi:hypothetical protein
MQKTFKRAISLILTFALIIGNFTFVAEASSASKTLSVTFKDIKIPRGEIVKGTSFKYGGTVTARAGFIFAQAMAYIVDLSTGNVVLDPVQVTATTISGIEKFNLADSLQGPLDTKKLDYGDYALIMYGATAQSLLDTSVRVEFYTPFIQAQFIVPEQETILYATPFTIVNKVTEASQLKGLTGVNLARIPPTVSEGSSFVIRGLVGTNAALTSVTVGIKNSSDAWVTGYGYRREFKSSEQRKLFNIDEANGAFVTATLPVGDYRYVVTAKDTTSSAERVLADYPFNIIPAVKTIYISEDGLLPKALPQSLAVYEDFDIKGRAISETGHGVIKELTVGVQNLDGQWLSGVYSQVKPRAFSYNLANENKKLNFASLVPGFYNLVVTAINNDGVQTILKHKFSVGGVSEIDPAIGARVDNCPLPENLTVGSSFDISGYITSLSVMDTVEIGVQTSVGNWVNGVYAKTANVNLKAYNIERSKNAVNFSRLPAGVYYFVVKVTSGGNSTKIVDHLFVVGDVKKPDDEAVYVRPSISIRNGNYPSSIALGATFTPAGIVESSTKLTSVAVGVQNNSGKWLTVKGKTITASVNPSAITYDISKLASRVSFTDLYRGEFFYVVTASNQAGDYTLISQPFLVGQTDKKPTYNTVVERYTTPDPGVARIETFQPNGKVKSNVTLWSLTVGLKDFEGKWVAKANQAAVPYLKEFDVSRFQPINFSDVPIGSYSYVLLAKTSVGETELINSPVTVGNIRPSALTISGENRPDARMLIGSSFLPAGVVSSPYNITNLFVGVMFKDPRDDTYKDLEGFYHSESGSLGKSINIGSDLIRGKIDFSKLPEGHYKYVVGAVDTESKTLVDADFAIETPPANITTSELVYPQEPLKEGSSFSLGGYVTTDITPFFVQYGVKDKDGEWVTDANHIFTSTTAMSLNLKQFTSRIKFQILAPGSYTYVISAGKTDADAKVVFESPFEVLGATFSVTGVTVPPSLVSATDSFTPAGVITSSSGEPITLITAAITDSNGVPIPGAAFTTNPGAATYDLSAIGNMSFALLPAGTYAYRVVAATATKTETVATGSFTVQNVSQPRSFTANASFSSNVIKGSTVTPYGSITASSTGAFYARYGAQSSNGAWIADANKEYSAANATSLNISSDMQAHLKKLDVGAYKYVIVAGASAAEATKLFEVSFTVIEPFTLTNVADPPSSYAQGSSFTPGGVITAADGAAVGTVLVAVAYQADPTQLIQSSNAVAPTSTYNLSSLTSFDLTSLESGSYVYIIAVNRGADVSVIHQYPFTVTSSEDPESTLAIAPGFNIPPSAISAGESMTFSGNITSNYIITSIFVGAATSTGDPVDGAYVLFEPSSESYDLSSLNGHLTFSGLAPGSYYYVIIASDEKQGNKALCTAPFTVLNATPSAFEATIKDFTPPLNLIRGDEYQLNGVISANADISEVSMQLVNKSDNSDIFNGAIGSLPAGNKEFDISEMGSEYAHAFRYFEEGDYTLYLRATDWDDNTVEVIKIDFTISPVPPATILYTPPLSSYIEGAVDYAVNGSVSSPVGIVSVDLEIWSDSDLIQSVRAIENEYDEFNEADLLPYQCELTPALAQDLDFASLPQGNYKYVISVFDGRESTTVAETPFSVVSPESNISFNSIATPDSKITVGSHTTFEPSGRVVSAKKLSSVTVGLAKADYTWVPGTFVAYENIGDVNEFEFNASIGAISFDSVPAGEYIYVVKAVDVGGTVVYSDPYAVTFENEPSTLALSGTVTAPDALIEGDDFDIAGGIASNYSITAVSAGARNASTKQWISGASDTNVAASTSNPTSFNLASMNNFINFGVLTPGTYEFAVVASDEITTNLELFTRTFTVEARPVSQLAISGANWPGQNVPLVEGDSFTPVGTITSNANLTTVIVAISLGGTEVGGAQATPTSTTYSLSSLSPLRIESLPASSVPYTYTVYAADTIDPTPRALFTQTFTINPKPISSEIAISVRGLPMRVTYRTQPLEIGGTITSAADLDNVVINVYQKGAGAGGADLIKQSASFSVYAMDDDSSFGDTPKSLDLSRASAFVNPASSINTTTLAKGDYLLTISAMDETGTEETFSHDFSIVDAPSYTVQGVELPTILNAGTNISADGKEFKIKGAIKSTTDPIFAVAISLLEADVVNNAAVNQKIVQQDFVALQPDPNDPASYAYNLGDKNWNLDFTTLTPGKFGIYSVEVYSYYGPITNVHRSGFMIQNKPNITLVGANLPSTVNVADKTPPMIVNGTITSDKPLTYVGVTVTSDYYIEYTDQYIPFNLSESYWKPNAGEAVTTYDLSNLQVYNNGVATGAKFNVSYTDPQLLKTSTGRELLYTIYAQNEDGVAYLVNHTFMVNHYFDFSDVKFPPDHFVAYGEEAMNYEPSGILKAPQGGVINSVKSLPYQVIEVIDEETGQKTTTTVDAWWGPSASFRKLPYPNSIDMSNYYDNMEIATTPPGVYLTMISVIQGLETSASNYVDDNIMCIFIATNPDGTVPGY